MQDKKKQQQQQVAIHPNNRIRWYDTTTDNNCSYYLVCVWQAFDIFTRFVKYSLKSIYSSKCSLNI